MASVTGIYARAFADVVFDRRLDPARALRQMQSFAALVSESKELREVLEAPSIPAEQKRKLLDAIAKREEISREARNFMAVLMDHGRIKFLQAIVVQLEYEFDERLGFVEAEITSARDLDEGERRELEAEVRKLTGRKVRALYTRETSLLGGAVIRVGSTIYDGSVKGQLEKIREQMIRS